MPGEIKGFQGPYRFLSNFYPCAVEYDGFHFRSSEAAYQAAKAFGRDERKQFTELDARQACALGKSLKEIHPDWYEIRLNVMYRVLRAKFGQNAELKAKLLATGDAYLEETNYWRDTFWGVYNGYGQNHLGQLLTLVRDELREGII